MTGGRTMSRAGKLKLLKALGRDPGEEIAVKSAAERYANNRHLDAWHALQEQYGNPTGMSTRLAEVSTKLRHACMEFLAKRGKGANDPIHTVEEMVGRSGMAMILEEVGV